MEPNRYLQLSGKRSYFRAAPRPDLSSAAVPIFVRLLQALREQLFGSIRAPPIFFLSVTHKLREILITFSFGVADVLIVSLGTLQCMIENADKVIGFISRAGCAG